MTITTPRIIILIFILTFVSVSQAAMTNKRSHDEMVYVTPEMESYYTDIVREGDSTLCDLCTFSVQVIRDEIKLGNTTIHVIEDVVQILCDIFNQKHTCEIIIDDINYIVDMIERGWTPLDICKVLHLCSDTHTTRTSKWYMRRETLKQNKTYMIYTTMNRYDLQP